MILSSIEDNAEVVFERTASIVMPAYNAALVLPRAITSVQNQSMSNWELLIVDDGSNDNTLEVIKTFAARDARVRYFTLPMNSGAAVARNYALKLAKGRYIAFLDADDMWMPSKLERQIGWMQVQSIPFSFTAYYRGNDSGWRRVDVPQSVSHCELLRGNVIGCLTAVYDRHSIGMIEMPDLRWRQDFAFWLEILKKTPRAYGLSEPLAFYYREPSRVTLSSNILSSSKAMMRIYRRQENLGVLEAYWCFFRHICRSILMRTSPVVGLTESDAFHRIER